jgi:hypothetical protein
MSKPNLKSQAKRKRELAKLGKRQAKDQKRAERKAERAGPGDVVVTAAPAPTAPPARAAQPGIRAAVAAPAAPTQGPDDAGSGSAALEDLKGRKAFEGSRIVALSAPASGRRDGRRESRRGMFLRQRRCTVAVRNPSAEGFVLRINLA